MTKQQSGDFCFDYARQSDGAVTFQCSPDARKWPWLKLPPAHNIAIQTTNYYALSGVSLFTGATDGEKWSAITDFAWQVGVGGAGERAAHPARGRSINNDDGIGYSCEFFDVDGRVVYSVTGAGVVFRNRDFEGWRAKSKAAVLATPAPNDFVYACNDAVGTASAAEVLVSVPVRRGADTIIEALVTQENGFPPAHPFHNGSGDHVNSSHLLDAVQQAAFQLRDHVFPSGGSATFRNYVELERPFQIVPIEVKENEILFSVRQIGKECAQICLTY